MTRPTWDQRMARAAELAEAYPFAAEVLGFYMGVARFQKALYGYVQQARGKSPLAPLRAKGAPGTPPLPGRSFQDCLDSELLLPRFPGFLNLVRQSAPEPLASAAEQLSSQGESAWEGLLRNFWQRSEIADLPCIESFFARAFLQPYAEYVAERLPAPVHTGNTVTCPVCDSEPVVAVLRDEQMGAKRSFICSLCAQEWEFLRVICPGCGEDRAEALCAYTSEQFHHVRVDACDTCKTYVKTVDLTRNGLAVPVVDELATLPLTLWAEQHGYAKLQPNLMAV